MLTAGRRLYGHSKAKTLRFTCVLGGLVTRGVCAPASGCTPDSIQCGNPGGFSG